MKFNIKEHSHTILLYIGIFLISILCHSSVLLLYSSDYGVLFYEEQASVLFILLQSLASVTMCFCLQHLHFVKKPSIYGLLIFSFSYSLCSYTFVQSKNWQNILVFILLPVLYYALEQMLLYNKTLLFMIVAAVCLSLDALTTASVLICLLFAVIFYLHSTEYRTLTSVLHYILVCIPSLLLSGVFSFPQFGEYFGQLDKHTYSGFQISLPISVFISRFFPGAVSSTVYNGIRGINVYYGLFALLCGLAFFFCKGIEKKRRLLALILSGIFIAVLQLSPLQFIAELFKASHSLYIYYDFFFVFFFLLIGFEGFEKSESEKIKELLFPVLVFAALILVTLAGASHNIHPMSRTTILAFGAVYILCFMLKNLSAGRIKKMLVACILLELTLNAVSVSFQDFVPESAACENRFSTASQNSSGTETGSVTYDTSDPSEQIYDDFCAEHVDRDLYYDLQKFEKVAVNAFGYEPDRLFSDNYFDRYNDMCHAIGMELNLFEVTDSASVQFQSDRECPVISEGHQLYYVYNATADPMPASKIFPYNVIDAPADFYVVFDLYETPFHFTAADADSQYTGYISLPIAEIYGSNFRVGTAAVNPKAYEQVKMNIELFYDYAALYFLPMPVYYASIAATCIGVFVVLFFTMNSDKKKYIDKLFRLKNKINESKLLSSVRRCLYENRIYFLSVLIPGCILLSCAVIFDLKPFGRNTIWEGDGLLSVLPFALNNIRSLKEGNWLISYNGGYGYSVLPTQPLYHLFALIVPQASLIVFFQYMVLSLIALSSFTMVYYLTHRLSGKAADKHDIKLLIPGLIFSLNSFMLYMRGYMNWYFIIALLPILVYALERLIYRKKWMLYVVLLSFCMYVDIPIAYIVCILLVLVFLFFEKFDSFKDFLIKGLRFGFCSILAALNAYNIIRGMFSVKTGGGTGYAETDSVKPTFRFFGSFFNQWKQHMIFCTSDVITGDRNSIVLYASILCVLLLVLYLLNKNIGVKEKIRRLAPIIILYFTFNENISSYIISGFHYQSNLPNRHVFIMLFLLCILIYDGISDGLPSGRWILISSFAIAVFFCLCQFLSDQNSMAAFVTSIILTVIYGAVLFLSKKKLPVSFRYEHFILVLLIAELCANTYFLISDMNLNAIAVLGDYNAVTEYFDTGLDTDNNMYRTGFVAEQTINMGMIYDTATIDYFIPNISQITINFNNLLGGTSGTNYVSSHHGNSAVTNTLFGVKYIAIPQYAITWVANLDCYNYIGSFDRYYFFENPDVLAPAYFAPDTITEVIEENKYSPFEVNDMISKYLPEADDIFAVTYLSNTTSETAEYDGQNNYTYIDNTGEPLLTSEALTYLKTLPDAKFNNDLFRMSVNITPEQDGFAYLYTNEYIPLDYLKAGETYHFDLYGPKAVEKDYHACFSINEETYRQFCEYMRDKQLTDLRYDKLSIIGNSHYTEDGYTLFCFPYSTSWEAFIDGEKTEVLSPHKTYMLVKTPAGEHEVKITLNRRMFNRNLIITGIFWVLTGIAFVVGLVWGKKSKAE